MLQFAGLASLPPPSDHPRSGAVPQDEVTQHSSDILESASFDLKLDKSNILMLGPTGTGKYLEIRCTE